MPTSNITSAHCRGTRDIQSRGLRLAVVSVIHDAGNEELTGQDVTSSRRSLPA